MCASELAVGGGGGEKMIPKWFPFDLTIQSFSFQSFMRYCTIPCIKWYLEARSISLKYLGSWCLNRQIHCFILMKQHQEKYFLEVIPVQLSSNAKVDVFERVSLLHACDWSLGFSLSHPPHCLVIREVILLPDTRCLGACHPQARRCHPQP